MTGLVTGLMAGPAYGLMAGLATRWGPSRRSRCRADELGGASVLVLVLVAAVTTLALAGVTVGGLLVGQRRASAAADLAALAGAEVLGRGAGSAAAGVAACEKAGRVSAANRARLTGCLVDGLEVVVEVAVDVPSAFGAGWSVPARARAGPAGAGPSGAGPAGTGPGGAGPARGSGGPAP